MNPVANTVPERIKEILRQTSEQQQSFGRLAKEHRQVIGSYSETIHEYCAAMELALQGLRVKNTTCKIIDFKPQYVKAKVL